MTLRKVMVKFRNASQASQVAQRVVKKIGRDAVRCARPLFPGESEPDLATLYEMDLAPEASADAVLLELQGDDDIEYAHFPEERVPKS